MDEAAEGEDKDERWVRGRRRGGSGSVGRHSLRRHSPPVSVDAVLEVQHGQPPHVHVQHVVVDDVLQDKAKKEGRGQGAEDRAQFD